MSPGKCGDTKGQPSKLLHAPQASLSSLLFVYFCFCCPHTVHNSKHKDNSRPSCRRVDVALTYPVNGHKYRAHDLLVSMNFCSPINKLI